MENRPSTNGLNGGDYRGRFTKGNPGGPGNPLAGRVNTLRAAILSALTEEDIQAIVGTLVDAAKWGNIAAAKFLFSYTIGQPSSAGEMEKWALGSETSVLRAELSNMSVAELLALRDKAMTNESAEQSANT